MNIEFLGEARREAARQSVCSILIDGKLLIGLSPDCPTEDVPGEPALLNAHKYNPFHPCITDTYTVTPFPARSGGTALIFLIEKDSKAFLCANNSGYFPEETWDALAGKAIHAVSLDCVSSEAQEAANRQTEEDVLTTRRRLYQLGCIKPAARFYVISSESGTERSELIERMSTRGVTVAYAGLKADF
jgi:phosphoribosyl 1,2-cyclic phosphate phosphodiesterase